MQNFYRDIWNENVHTVCNRFGVYIVSCMLKLLYIL